MLLGCRSAPATTSTAAASEQPPSADGTPGADSTPDGPAAPESPAGEGEPCLSPKTCESGVCEGQGCGDDTPGTCASRERMCTRDARQYCGCDGETFVSSGSCPGQRYASAGPCEGDAGLGGAAVGATANGSATIQ